MEFLDADETTSITDAEHEQVWLIKIGSPVLKTRLSLETVRAYVLTGLSHYDLSNIGEYTHLEIDEVVEDFTLHAANQAVHLPQQIEYFNLSLLNSWDIYGSGYYRPAYGLDAFGNTVLRGTAKDGTIGQSIALLPVAFRPSGHQLHPCVSSGALGIVKIGSDGYITPLSGSSSAFSLDGVIISRTEVS